MIQASPQQPLPHIEGVDMPAALARLAGNSKLLFRLFGDFKTQNHDMVGKIRETLQTGDTETAVRLLHTLKGVAANLAMNEVSEAAKDAESAAREHEDSKLEPALSVLQTRLDALCAAIHAATATTEAPAAPARAATTAAGMSGLVKQAMAETIRLVSQQSPDATFVFETIRSDISEHFPAQAESIASHLDQYAFTQAGKELKALADELGLPC